jgi:pSer/pThr/pTyr-binding forkhead associated (FHA) protein
MDTVMVVEVLGGHNRVRARHRIAATGAEAHCTVGRGAACDVVLDDPFVAPLHARIAVDVDGNVAVSDLESVNGIEVGGRRVHGGPPVRLADGLFRIGRTRLHVRTAHDAIAPEQVDRGGLSWQTRAVEQRVLAAGLAVSVAVSVFEVWTNTAQPRDLSTALVTMLLAMFALAGLWIALWALASRVAFGESHWARHAVIVFVVFAVFTVVSLVIEVVNGALGLHLSLSVIDPVLIGIALSVALSSHLVNASPTRPRIAVAIGVAIPAIVIATMLWTQARSHARSPSHIADNDRMLPPALVLRRGLPLDGFTAKLADLRHRADAKRAFVEREDPSPDDDDSD